MKTELRLKELLDWLQDEGSRADLQTDDAGNNRQLCLAAFNSAHIDWTAPLPGDASFRRYCRIEAPTGERLMLVDAPPPHESTQPFAGIAKAWRNAGIAVPIVYAVNDADGFMALEDLGNQTLFDLTGSTVRADNKAIEYQYEAAIEELCLIQKLDATQSGSTQEMPSYDEALLRRETALFRDWLLDECLQLGRSVIPDTWNALHALDGVLVAQALAQPRCVVHRDYHSRNLMLDDRQLIRPIDFQDAVVGPASYDLVSLLKDCYVRLAPEMRERLFVHYLACSEIGGFSRIQFELMGMQRHLKAAGIFARLYRRDGKARYLEDIPQVLSYLIETTETLGTDPQLTNFMTPLNRALQREIVPAFQTFRQTQ